MHICFPVCPERPHDALKHTKHMSESESYHSSRCFVHAVRLAVKHTNAATRAYT